MNVIMILCDTLRRDHCSPYNHGRYLNECWSTYQPHWKVETPNMERLARRGTVFDNAYCGSTPCMPARRDIYTGRFEFLWRGWGPLNDEDADLPCQISGPADYSNRSIAKKIKEDSRISYLVTDHFHLWECGAGNYHFGYTGCELIRGHEGDMWNTAPIEVPCPNDSRMTFDERHFRNAYLTRKSEEDYFAAQVFTKASEWLEANRSLKNFYLHIDCFDPHEPWDPPEKYLKMFDERGYDVPDWKARAPYDYWENTMKEEQYHHLRARYAATVVFLDHWFGKLLDTIDNLDLWKDTLVIFSTDHGTFNGDFGRMGKLQTHEYDACGHIPLIIYHPVYGHGERRSQLVQPVDFYPTVLNAVGKSLPRNASNMNRDEVLGGLRDRNDGKVKAGANSADDFLRLLMQPGMDSIHGVDILPVFENKDAKTHDYAIMGQYGKSVSITDGHWILHQSPVEGNAPLYWHDYCLARFLRYDLGEYHDGYREVYNCNAWKEPTWLSNKDNDMSEFVNLAEKHPEKVLEMQHALKQVMTEIGAPPEQFIRLGLE